MSATEDLGGLGGPPHPVQSRQREHHRVDSAVVRQRDSGVDVASHGDDGQIGAQPQQGRGPARAARADPRADRQLRQGEPVARHEDVLGRSALGHGCDDEAGHRCAGQVLVGVHDEVDAAGQQRVAQRGHERPWPRRRVERDPGVVALGADRDELARHTGGSGDRRRDLAGLGAGEHARAGAEPEHQETSIPKRVCMARR